MFYIVEVQGCEPYVNLVLNEDGETSAFDTAEEATAYAKENCAWEYQIIEF